LNVHVAQLNFFNTIPCTDVIRPFLLIGRQIRATLGKVLREVACVKGKILGKIVRLIRGVRALFEVTNFLFRRRGPSMRGDKDQCRRSYNQKRESDSRFAIQKPPPRGSYLTINL
jgi:hypothetical protein